jgi:predicted nucleic acid-binding protein
MMRPRPEPDVAAYLRACPIEDLFLPIVVAAERRYGLALLPRGRRRSALESNLNAVLAQGFQGRILVFDEACAAGYATVRSARERAGRPVPMADALIGGMPLAHGATLATRNVADFTGYGLAIVNPWNGQ